MIFKATKNPEPWYFFVTQERKLEIIDFRILSSQSKHGINKSIFSIE